MQCSCHAIRELNAGPGILGQCVLWHKICLSACDTNINKQLTANIVIFGDQ
jgi:hypothetical protein